MQTSIFHAMKSSFLGNATDWYKTTFILFPIITCPQFGSSNGPGQHIANPITAVLLYGKFLISKMAQFGTQLLLSTAGRTRQPPVGEPSGSVGLLIEYDGLKMSQQTLFHSQLANFLGNTPHWYKTTIVPLPCSANRAVNDG